MNTPGRIIQFQVTGEDGDEKIWALDDKGQLWIGYMATLTPASWQWDKVDGPT
jgi:hypothetical protein